MGLHAFSLCSIRHLLAGQGNNMKHFSFVALIIGLLISAAPVLSSEPKQTLPNTEWRSTSTVAKAVWVAGPEIGGFGLGYMCTTIGGIDNHILFLQARIGPQMPKALSQPFMVVYDGQNSNLDRPDAGVLHTLGEKTFRLGIIAIIKRIVAEVPSYNIGARLTPEAIKALKLGKNASFQMYDGDLVFLDHLPPWKLGGSAQAINKTKCRPMDSSS
jgi:hypothetical protein